MKATKTESKTERMLMIYRRLCGGEVVSKKEIAAMFGVDDRSVQRDMTHGYSIYSLRKEGGPGRKDMGRLMRKYVGESEERELICG